MARYELPDDMSGKFFEITLAGNRVVTRTGTVGAFARSMDGKTIYGSDRGRDGGRTYKDAAAAQRAYDKAVAAKKAEGYRRVDRPDDDAPAAAVEVHRDPALEAAIVAAAPGDTAPYAVYGDWLQQRGDPRGEMIALQLAMQQQRDPIAYLGFKQREQALRFQHERAWLGEVTVACAHRTKLDWRLGFVESARIAAATNPTEPPIAAVLASLLRSPAGCAVRALELEGRRDARGEELVAALALLPVPGLRKVTGGSWWDVAADELARHRDRITAAGVTVTIHSYADQP